MDYITGVGVGISFILACAGAFFAYRCWKLWRHTNITGLGLWVTRDKSFLSNNFKLVIIIGGLSSLHVLFELVEQLDILMPQTFWKVFHIAYFSDLVALMFVFLMLAITWYRLLSKVNTWDKRWITQKK